MIVGKWDKTILLIFSGLFGRYSAMSCLINIQKTYLKNLPSERNKSGIIVDLSFLATNILKFLHQSCLRVSQTTKTISFMYAFLIKTFLKTMFVETISLL